MRLFVLLIILGIIMGAMTATLGRLWGLGAAITGMDLFVAYLAWRKER